MHFRPLIVAVCIIAASIGAARADDDDDDDEDVPTARMEEPDSDSPSIVIPQIESFGGADTHSGSTTCPSGTYRMILGYGGGVKCVPYAQGSGTPRWDRPSGITGGRR